MFGGCGGSGATSRAELELQREVEVPQLKLLRVNRQLAMKPQHASRLELLLHERLNKIDQLTAQVDYCGTGTKSWAWRTRSSLR